MRVTFVAQNYITWSVIRKVRVALAINPREMLLIKNELVKVTKIYVWVCNE